MKRQQYIDQVLTDEQLELLKKWAEVNNLDINTIEFYDDCKFGIRIFMRSEDNGESWEIDFTTDDEFEKAVDAMDDIHSYGKTLKEINKRIDVCKQMLDEAMDDEVERRIE